MKAWKNINTLEILNDIQDFPNPLPSEYNAEEWELVEVPEAEIAAQFPPERAVFLQKLNDDLHTYLNERGYDRDTQISLQALYVDLLEKQLTGQGKQQIRVIFDFVIGIVLPWYYAKKGELEEVENYQSFTWNFSELDDYDPGISLREIMDLYKK